MLARYQYGWLDYPFTYNLLMAYVAPVVGPFLSALTMAIIAFFMAMWYLAAAGLQWLIGLFV